MGGRLDLLVDAAGALDEAICLRERRRRLLLMFVRRRMHPAVGHARVLRHIRHNDLLLFACRRAIDRIRQVALLRQ